MSILFGTTCVYILSGISVHTENCNDVITGIPFCVSSSLCNTLILRSERSSHWRKSGVCASGYACGTSLSLVIDHHLLTQRKPGHYHTTVIIIEVLICIFIHASDWILGSSTEHRLLHFILGNSYRCWSWLLVLVGLLMRPTVFVLTLLFPSLPASLLLSPFISLLMFPLPFQPFLLLPFLLCGLHKT